MEKAAFREKQIKLLSTIDEVSKANKETAIARVLFQQNEFIGAKNIAITLSHGFELNTNDIIEKMRQMGKNVFIPRTLPKRQMEFVEFTSETKLEPKVFGILEPQNGRVIQPEKLDLIIVPGLAYETTSGYRLGFGGGYYDRFLLKTQAPKIVLAFSEQIYSAPQWSVERFDIPLDKIISENGIQFDGSKGLES
ncbi:5-formyltetrahydrofolate cyclo-ligase [Pediococcus stilesii]|uniref:5-formyltetrahydrofolate cyclo-ligase n=1 Tax=Pediococcus stilesii TaxID=331679 RepID=A0A0R2KTE6_9LACO|nr:5-formyltetrahydrofolate cyclo-ligase [Pediococcus stilesii]KRN92672.1 5-formyltetrahydrofolate cyclo-ligase [Pediococcus stilesii]